MRIQSAHIFLLSMLFVSSIAKLPEETNLKYNGLININDNKKFSETIISDIGMSNKTRFMGFTKNSTKKVLGFFTWSKIWLFTKLLIRVLACFLALSVWIYDINIFQLYLIQYLRNDLDEN